ncbi:MAG: hypothetical protein J5621_06860 [Paludibacteraceae bacterium]|nr:hypothetical protein [Paludibacteraceae bacterium]
MEFDPNATTELKLLIDDEIPKFVTIEELQELLKEKTYQTGFDDYILGLKSEERDVEDITPDEFTLFPYWIASHLLVQTCMQDIEAYDWAKITDMYNIYRIAEIAYIACNPYVWQPIENRAPDTIIQGRIATLQYHAAGVTMAWLNKMVNEPVLFLADKRPEATVDTQVKGVGKVLKGMMLWNLLVNDGRNFIKQFLVEHVPEGADVSIKYFATDSFRENIQYIAEQRGPQVAAELIRALRKDWPGIVAWKCFCIDTLTPEQVEKFRACLFEGMDYYLEQWDVEQASNARRKTLPADTVLPIPQEGKYTEVRKYIEERKRYDQTFKEYCLNHTLRDLCNELSRAFGWLVDENSLGRNINRNR